MCHGIPSRPLVLVVSKVVPPYGPSLNTKVVSRYTLCLCTSQCSMYGYAHLYHVQKCIGSVLYTGILVSVRWCQLLLMLCFPRVRCLRNGSVCFHAHWSERLLQV